MTFVFDEEAGKEAMSLKGEQFKYLVKVRRHGVGDKIAFRRQEASQRLFIYELTAIEARSAQFRLLEERELIVKAAKSLHLGWCVIDQRSVEKALPSLNEMGVEKITFIYCDRSQKNFRPDLRRFERILMASMQQCGRSQMMAFDIMDDLETFLKHYPESIVLDLCDRVFDETVDVSEVLIGTEGGFSEREKALYESLDVYRLDTPMVLRSETAATAISAKILL